MSHSVQVRLPPVLRTVMDGRQSVEGEGTTIDGVLKFLAAAHPALGLHLVDESGQPRRNIVCLHQDALIRTPDFAHHAVGAGDELVLTNALAGG